MLCMKKRFFFLICLINISLRFEFEFHFLFGQILVKLELTMSDWQITLLKLHEHKGAEQNRPA